MRTDDFMNDTPIEYETAPQLQEDTPQSRSRKKAGKKTRSSRAASGKNAADREGNSGYSKQGRSSKSTLIRRIVIFSALEIITLVSIFAYAYVLKQYNKIQRPEFNVDAVRNENLSLEHIQQMEEGYWNIAVFGVDSRDSSVGFGANSDVNIIVSINRETGEIKLVSVFRDTYLKVGDDSYNKINSAYCTGGPEKALKALNENLDLNITEYCTFNWKAVANAINILGGVDVELSKAEFYYINSYITETVKATGIYSVHLEHAGMNHLDGVQAVAYARLRYMDNDYARTERQRKIIQLAFDKAKHADAATLDSLLGNTLEQVATNLTWIDGYNAIADLPKYNISETAGFPTARGEGNIGKIGDCVIPQTLEGNVIALHAFLFGEENYDPSEAVKNISKHISAASGMYNEGTPVGHVSTEGVIIPVTPRSETEEQETDENGEVINKSTSSNSNSKRKVEYSISRDGYLIYVSGKDPSGNKKYSYVLDDEGKRIKMITTDDEGNTVYLYEVDEDGNFYFDLPENVRVPVDEDEEEEEPEGQASTESDAQYGPGQGPATPETTQAEGPGNPRESESHYPGESIPPQSPSPLDNNPPGGPGGGTPGDVPESTAAASTEAVPPEAVPTEQAPFIPGGDADLVPAPPID